MIDPRVKYRHIQCFLEVARLRSLVKAAEELSITQPAVSKTLRELEEILEVRLFDRSRKGVVLTQFGEVLLHYAGASLAALKQGLDSVAQARMSGESYLNIGVLPSVAARIVPTAVQRFLAESVETTLTLITGPNTFLSAAFGWGNLIWWSVAWLTRSRWRACLSPISIRRACRSWCARVIRCSIESRSIFAVLPIMLCSIRRRRRSSGLMWSAC